MHDFKPEHFKFGTFSAACCVQEVSAQIFFWLWKTKKTTLKIQDGISHFEADSYLMCSAIEYV